MAVVCLVSRLYQPVIGVCRWRLVSVFSHMVICPLGFKIEVRRAVLLFEEHGSGGIEVEAG
ncbi:hypothetical protein D3I60_09215 [Brevibacterium permense]|nr:hypothetical protein [Brevibacterium permense]